MDFQVSTEWLTPNKVAGQLPPSEEVSGIVPASRPCGALAVIPLVYTVFLSVE